MDDIIYDLNGKAFKNYIDMCEAWRCYYPRFKEKLKLGRPVKEILLEEQGKRDRFMKKWFTDHKGKSLTVL